MDRVPHQPIKPNGSVPIAGTLYAATEFTSEARNPYFCYFELPMWIKN
jgi:hypothetical protein